MFANWDDSRVKTAEYLSLYPNVLLGIQADHFFAILLMPESPETTTERLQFLYSSEEALTDVYAERRALINLGKTFPWLKHERGRAWLAGVQFTGIEYRIGQVLEDFDSFPYSSVSLKHRWMEQVIKDSLLADRTAR